jgi:glycosyltransferase involved in cell wall biosynthesis
MRIVLAHSHANTFGGGERSVLELARQLAERHEVRLLLGGFDPRRTYAELGTFRPRRVGRLLWPVLKVGGDAIITNSFGSNLLALRNGARVIYWVHSVRSIFLAGGPRRVDLVARRAVDWFAVRRAARVVANSRYTANRVRQLYGREPDATVYPGVDLELFRPSVGGPRGYAITVGRLSPEKGLDRLLDLWRDLPDLPLHVGGSGPPEVERELRERAPPDVVFRGGLSPAAVADAYHGAAVAVFAAYGEEFGIAPLEAMASGVPVIAWREGGLVETVVDGRTGYLVGDPVTFRQRLRLLLHDPERWHTLSRFARQRAEEFSWQRTAAEMEAVCLGLAVPPVRELHA